MGRFDSQGKKRLVPSQPHYMAHILRPKQGNKQAPAGTRQGSRSRVVDIHMFGTVGRELRARVFGTGGLRLIVLAEGSLQKHQVRRTDHCRISGLDDGTVVPVVVAED